jgi:hypothetical protein
VDEGLIGLPYTIVDHVAPSHGTAGTLHAPDRSGAQPGLFEVAFRTGPVIPDMQRSEWIMNTRKMVCVLCATCLITFGASTAAWAGGSAFAGMAMPTGNFGDAAGAGYFVGGAYDMPVTPLISAGVRGAYNRFGWDNDVDGNFNSIEAMAYGKVASPAGPFGMVGLGLANSEAVVGDLSSDRQTDLKMAIGAGYSLTKVEISAMYHSISTEGSSINYFTLAAGMGF